MKLIVGLGNIGDKFINTRHNAGFMFVEHLVNIWGSKLQQNERITPWEFEKMYNCDVAYLIGDSVKTVMFAKPRTYMNESGVAIRKMMEKNAITKEGLFVAYDDMDIKLGEYKLNQNKSPKGHNGILSIEQQVKSIDFMHVRIGVDSRSPEYRIPGLDYVLMKMNSSELGIINSSIDLAVRDFLSLIGS